MIKIRQIVKSILCLSLVSTSLVHGYTELQQSLNAKRGGNMEICAWSYAYANHTVAERGLCTEAGRREGCKVREVGQAAGCD